MEDFRRATISGSVMVIGAITPGRMGVRFRDRHSSLDGMGASSPTGLRAGEEDEEDEEEEEEGEEEGEEDSTSIVSDELEEGDLVEAGVVSSFSLTSRAPFLSSSPLSSPFQKKLRLTSMEDAGVRRCCRLRAECRPREMRGSERRGRERRGRERKGREIRGRERRGARAVSIRTRLE
jgi:hypothetical protein